MSWPINHKPGTIPGEKRKSEGIEKKEDKVKKLYEEHRSTRSFNEKWITENPWLKHDESGMKCTVCVAFYKTPGKNVFVTSYRSTTV